MEQARDMSSLEKAVLAEISADRLWQHVEFLSTLDRGSGRPGEEVAAKYIQAQLQEYGVEAEIYEFESWLSYSQESSLEVLAPTAASIKGRSLAFTAPTPDDGVRAELAFAGTGLAADYEGVAVDGKVVVIQGEGSPAKVLEAERRGAAGVVFANNEDVIHEFTANPIWGTPTPETIGTLPKIFSMSITRKDGDHLKELASQGVVTVRLTGQATLDWQTVRLPVGTINVDGDGSDYVLIGGHLCSWYLGSTDNATGNACCLELARVLSMHRGLLRRSVKVAWWPGHSQGRYSGSTWYADTYWEDLHRHAVAYVNIDSPGIKGSEVFTCRAMAELEELAQQVLKDVTNQAPEIRRPTRASDQSFWGVGVPSLAVSCLLPPGDPLRRVNPFGSGGGMWWHSPLDTIEYADKDVLHRDTGLFATFAARLAALDVLPNTFAKVGQEIARLLAELEQASGGALALSGLIARAEEFVQEATRIEALAEQLAAECAEGDANPETPARLARVNHTLMKLSRILNPPLYSNVGMFHHPPAVAIPLLPGLQSAAQLASLDPGSDEYKFLRTRLLRERNRVVHALSTALEEVRAI
jgi:Iap family predicted aminopeptidase